MENTNKIIHFLKSKILAVAICVAFVLALLVGTFSLGVMVGYHKARYSYAWGENYHRNFGGHRRGFMGDMDGGDLIDAHGTAGQIVRIDGSTMVVAGSDNTEKIVVLKADTLVRKFRDTVTIKDLKPDDYVVVIGEPTNDGQLIAKLIRILPSSKDTFNMPVPR